MSEAEITVYEPPVAAVMPVMSIDQAVERYKEMTEFVGKILRDGVDFGTIPGTGTKPTLLKPGAEKLTTFFGLIARFVTLEKVLDWTGEEHRGEPFFFYEYACQLYRQNQVVGEGIGSCNSWEKKYRYRTASLTCPNCKQSTVIKSKAQFGGGWFCWQKKGGCGSKWDNGDPAIEKQERGTVPNDSPSDLVNTISKMAQKRALVAATLITVNASEFFTQDIEDLDIVDSSPNAPARRPPAQKTKQPRIRQAQQAAPAPQTAPPWDNEIAAANDQDAPGPVTVANPVNGNGNSADSEPVALPEHLAYLAEVEPNADRDDQDWDAFRADAMPAFGFDHSRHLSNTLTKHLGKAWGKQFSKSQLWAFLAAHKEEAG